MITACKKCRREGEKLLLKGERCLSQKCAIVKRSYAPGEHGQSFRGKSSEYGKQLREKQRAKRIYGIDEKQFANYVRLAGKSEGNTAENLVKLLETRFDNVVYRAGWANSRSQARQMVSHRQFQLNSKKVNIPSCLIKVGDIIKPAKKIDTEAARSSWFDFDSKKNEIEIKQIPTREEIDTTLNENLIIEYYSR